MDLVPFDAGAALLRCGAAAAAVLLRCCGAALLHYFKLMLVLDFFLTIKISYQQFKSFNLKEKEGF